MNNYLNEKNNFIIVIMVAGIFAVFFSYFFTPGFMSQDSLTQYRQMTGQIAVSDAHPVIMVYLWKVLYKIFATSGIMLFFHQLLYWLSGALLAIFISQRLHVRLLILTVAGLWPPLIIISLHVWKDAGMMVMLSLCSVSLLAYNYQPDWKWLGVTLICLSYAIAVRVNGFIPGMIFAAYICYLILKKISGSVLKKTVLMFSLLMVMFFSQLVIINTINSRSEKIYTTGTLLLWDIAAISVYENKNLIPSWVPVLNKDKILLTELARYYTPLVNVPLYGVISPYLDNNKDRNALMNYWVSMVLTYPEAYLHHRLRVFNNLLGLNKDEVYYAYNSGIKSNNLSLKFSNLSDNSLDFVLRLFNWASSTLFYRAWIYVIISIGVFIFSCYKIIKNHENKNINILIAVISLSGIVNVASLFVIATAADFRYIIWTIFSSIISLLILFFNKKKVDHVG